jgi:hypothetical protein
MPRTLNSDLMRDYVEVPTTWNYTARLYCYRPNDPRVCLIFDYGGNIAGMQISVNIQKRIGVINKIDF